MTRAQALKLLLIGSGVAVVASCVVAFTSSADQVSYGGSPDGTIPAGSVESAIDTISTRLRTEEGSY